jgi:hypothetical protein
MEKNRNMGVSTFARTRTIRQTVCMHIEKKCLKEERKKMKYLKDYGS